MIHAYGVVRAPAPETPVPGIDDAPLRAVRHDDLAVIGSDHQAQPRLMQRHLVEHARVLDALLPHGVVPLRYGTVLTDDAAVASLLAERAGQFHRLLGMVHGRREMGVRISVPTGRSQATTGREYLLGKLAVERGAGRLADDLARAVGTLAVDRRLLATGADLRVAYLVEANRVGDFRTRIGSLSQRGAEVVCTGPWPAYSFVTEDQP